MRKLVVLTIGISISISLQPAQAFPTNLSTSGTAAASSVYADLEDYIALRANDGSRFGAEFWHSHNFDDQPLWWEVDLGANFYLDRVQIFPRSLAQALVKNFTIDVYNTANENVFSQLFLPRRSTGDAAWATDELRNVLGSRVRITRDPRLLLGWDSAMTFAEFEVWGDTTPNLENLALNRPVTASPALSGVIPTTANLANDGNLSGTFYLESIYLSDTPAAGQFWQVDLESLNAISYVNVFARTDDVTQNGNIRISILAANGTTVVDSADTTLAGEDLFASRYDITQMFSGNPVGKFVRIETLDSDKMLALAEVQVFGVAAGSAASILVPEPQILTLAAIALAMLTSLRSRRRLVLLAFCLCASLLHVKPTWALPTNLAPSGTATASSFYDVGFEPTNANDGNRAGDVIWHSAVVTATDPLWFEVDLGNDFYLDRVEILPRNEFQITVKDFTIDVFNTANVNVFSQDYFPDKATGDVPWATNAMRNVFGSRIRITREPPHYVGFDNVMTFAEFEVWGQSQPLPTNLAAGRPVTSSPSLVSVGPTDGSLAVDGDLSGHFWHESVYVSDYSGEAPFTGPYGNGHFWQVELAEPTAIDYVNLFARTDNMDNTPGEDISQRGPIRISIVGADGTTIVESVDTSLAGTDLGAQRYDLTQSFPTNPVGKYVRVEALDTNLGLELGEVEVFGIAETTKPFGDYNGNGTVDAADFVLWRKNLGTSNALPNDNGLGTPIGSDHYSLWKMHFGETGGGGASLQNMSTQVPEPSAAALICLGSLAFGISLRRRIQERRPAV